MIQILDHFDPRTAAGIVARAALSLEERAPNPASVPRVSDELDLRTSLLKEIRGSLGIDPYDNSEAAIEKLGDALDELADEISRPDVEGATLRLSDKGELPSDRYRIDIHDPAKLFYGKQFWLEEPRVVETVRRPDFEQHFAKENNPSSLISLFARFYRSKYPNRNFWLLVSGQRRADISLSIPLVLRLYPALVKVKPSSDLIAMLRVFADEYGKEVGFGGERGKLLISTSLPDGMYNFESSVAPQPGTETTLVAFTMSHDRQIRASLVMAINSTKYTKVLEQMHWTDPTLPR